MHWIGLLDCNNFFVSCERLFRPDLMGKPVVVLSSNDGCIVARSQEVKDIGVPMGVPYFQIKDTLKNNAVSVFSSHFALYRDISRRVFEVMRVELETVEQYSIDEAFFEISDVNPARLIQRVKAQVEQQVGIPVSIGVAATKTQAKYANNVAKKGQGTFVLTTDWWQQNAENIPLQVIWGIGGRMEMSFKKHGLHTVADLLTADQARVSRLFGVVGMRLRAELAGKSVQTLHQVREPQKTVMSTRSFRSETTEYSVVADAIAYHARHAMADVRSMGMRTSVVRLMILPNRHGDFMLRGRSVEAVLPAPTGDTIAVMRILSELLEQVFEPGVPYKKAGVVLSGLMSTDNVQENLFTSEPYTNESLMKVIDRVNGAAHKELVTVGNQLRHNQWSARVDAQSPAYTTRWSQIATVQS